MSDLLTPCVRSSNRINDRGYPVIWREGRHVREHRWVYVSGKGLHLEDIRGMSVRHKCDNPACVNLEHLELGTHADNMRDMAIRGRCSPKRGSTHKCAKLSETDIPVIRNLVSAGESRASVARLFQVDAAVVQRIIRGESWSHIK